MIIEKSFRGHCFITLEGLLTSEQLFERKLPNSHSEQCNAASHIYHATGHIYRATGSNAKTILAMEKTFPVMQSNFIDVTSQ